nr:glycosyl hydrolase [Winogradskyella forsetii]
MVTVAVSEDGTGKSKNYIASEEDLIIDELPEYLMNDISFIRVIPWNWVNKKGRTGPDTELNNTWKYLWSNTGNSSIELEYAPMSWGAGGADDDGDIELYKSKYKATHVMGFNESDNCDDQSGQFANLCDTDVAVNLYKNLMKTGLRMVSPSCRENAPFGWLKEFHDKANLQDIRIDVIAVHWYDWGSGPTNSPNADPQAVFNRFVTYLENVHNLYGLPIWITEFNANPNRSTATNYGFMQLALPYLESLDYVERYVWYQPNSGVADYYDSNGNTLTDVGTFYRDQISISSIPEATLSDDSNLDIYYDLINGSPTDNLFINGDFELGNLTSWNGSNIGTLSNANVYQGTTSGRILANAGNISQIVNVEPLEDYDLSFYTKWFVTPTEPIEVKILDASNDQLIASKLMTTSTTWNLVELSFTIPADVNSVQFIAEKGASTPGWFIDNAVLVNSEVLNLNEFGLNTLKIYPNPSSGIFSLNSKTPIESYCVYDLQGRLIKSKNGLSESALELNLTTEKKGIYFLRITDINQQRQAKKLILK